MSNFTLRPAKRSNAKPLIGLYSESGCGKTKSALLLARGFIGGDMSKVAMIETESGRGEAYADDPVVGGYQVLSLRDDFSPENYGQAIKACERANVSVLIIDSASHEWEGAGGVLSMAAENEAKGWKGQVVWTKPKMAHAREFMLRLMQTPIPLVIVCMRAKYPLVEFINEKGKKDMKRADVPSPKQSEDILYEMFVHGWIDQQHRFHGTNYLLEETRQCIRDGEPITEESGKRLAAWAAGKTASAAREPSTAPGPSPDVARVAADPTDDQLAREVAAFVKSGEYDAALDLASNMKDEARRELAMDRIRALREQEAKI